ncbi:MAG: FtsQ-type POTRA domain-containing protein [Rhabdochlamydiaceae bacterium]|nr:FtsQ-type POTRA domain-containing protein [Candidatus Amphrikana amoebophyrae]
MAAKLKDPKFLIQEIVQTGPQKEALSTQYIAQLLELSADKPTHMVFFDEKMAEAKLLRSPLIKYCQVKKMLPSTIYVDYELRSPIAIIGDYQNIAMDEEENLFPLKPFFTPQVIPEIYLGVNEVDDFELDLALPLALKVLTEGKNQFSSTRLKIIRIDVSRAFLSSLGQKEIVAKLEDELHYGNKSFTFTYLLRLNCKEYKQNMRQFFALRKELLKEQKKYCSEFDDASESKFYFTKTIDLRIDSLAYINTG